MFVNVNDEPASFAWPASSPRLRSAVRILFVHGSDLRGRSWDFVHHFVTDSQTKKIKVRISGEVENYWDYQTSVVALLVMSSPRVRLAVRVVFIYEVASQRQHLCDILPRCSFDTA